MIVYKTTNIITGKIYVGKDERNDSSYIGSGYLLKKSIKKYGKENFIKEILEECDTRESLEERERFWIRELNALDPKIGYNVAEGGSGGNTYLGKTEEEMIEIRQKISDAGKGRKFSEEHRQKLAESARRRKGNKPCKYKGMKYEDYMDESKVKDIKEKIKIARSRQIITEETKEKLSKTLKGRKLGPMTEEHKENLSKSKGTPVTINGVTYRSINHASKELGIPKYKIKQLGLSSTEPW